MPRSSHPCPDCGETGAPLIRYRRNVAQYFCESCYSEFVDPEGEMVQKNTIYPELEEQRCLIEQQQVQIQRLQRQLQLQAQLTTIMQSELDSMRVALQVISPPSSRNRSNRNAHPIASVP